jgi:hypothetical protein
MYSSVSHAVAVFFEELERLDSQKRPLTACEDLVLRTALGLLNRNPRLSLEVLGTLADCRSLSARTEAPPPRTVQEWRGHLRPFLH